MRREIPKFWQSDLSKGHFLLKTGPRLPKPRSFARAVTLLELLAGAAGTRVVAANFGAGADDLLDGRLLGPATSHFGLLEFALFLALELVFDFVNRRGNITRALAVGRRKSRAIFGRRLQCSTLRTLKNLHQIQIPDRVFLEALHHFFEHVERFTLIFHQRVVLSVATKADTLLKVVHVQEVVLPKLINDAEHDHALVVAHGVGSEELLLGLVAVFEFLENRVPEFGAIEALHVDAFRGHIHSEAGENSFLQALEVPGLDVGFRWTVLF